MDVPFTQEEIADVIASLKNDKSHGIDGFSAELYKALWEHAWFKEAFTELQNVTYKAGYCPSSWKKVVVVILYKKGSPDDVRNYRPISVTGVDYKIQSRMLTSRLNKVLPQFISKDQVGFMHDHFIHENITIVQSMLDAGPEGGGVHFSDFAAAFPSLPHNCIHELLVALKFPPGFRKMVRVYHEDIEGTIKVNGGVGGHFKMSRGVKQGCPMAPLLFNLAIECFIREVASRTEGLEMEGHFIKL